MIPDIDISNVILRTPRLTLRPWSWDDLEDLYSYNQSTMWFPK